MLEQDWGEIPDMSQYIKMPDLQNDVGNWLSDLAGGGNKEVWDCWMACVCVCVCVCVYVCVFARADKKNSSIMIANAVLQCTECACFCVLSYAPAGSLVCFLSLRVRVRAFAHAGT